MKNRFSIGELAAYQNISKQTLIYYDKIGLFQPDYVHPQTGYRYYSARQLDVLDTILVMKKCGFSLEQIKDYLVHRNLENSRDILQQQMRTLEQKIRELQLIHSRIAHKCDTLQQAIQSRDSIIRVVSLPAQTLLFEPVAAPYSLTEISIATKKCFAKAFEHHLPIFFETGVSVPLERLRRKQYIQASIAFLPMSQSAADEMMLQLPKGTCVIGYHEGNYGSIGETYERIFAYCQQHRLTITSDSYEFCINDHLTSADAKEYITRIQFYVEPAR